MEYMKVPDGFMGSTPIVVSHELGEAIKAECGEKK
jgi:hypothetical protein